MKIHLIDPQYKIIKTFKTANDRHHGKNLEVVRAFYNSGNQMAWLQMDKDEYVDNESMCKSVRNGVNSIEFKDKVGILQRSGEIYLYRK